MLYGPCHVSRARAFQITGPPRGAWLRLPLQSAGGEYWGYTKTAVKRQNLKKVNELKQEDEYKEKTISCSS